mmetsp:Transcript_27169/g.68983  ORF Transcript_27169/g.68983 Transcript_27169/m.68983 type:complete len:267 (-) Transcript_27169:1974-2774(-)
MISVIFIEGDAHTASSQPGVHGLHRLPQTPLRIIVLLPVVEPADIAACDSYPLVGLYQHRDEAVDEDEHGAEVEQQHEHQRPWALRVRCGVVQVVFSDQQHEDAAEGRPEGPVHWQEGPPDRVCQHHQAREHRRQTQEQPAVAVQGLYDRPPDDKDLPIDPQEAEEAEDGQAQDDPLQDHVVLVQLRLVASRRVLGGQRPAEGHSILGEQTERQEAQAIDSQEAPDQREICEALRSKDVGQGAVLHPLLIRPLPIDLEEEDVQHDH